MMNRRGAKIEIANIARFLIRKDYLTRAEPEQEAYSEICRWCCWADHTDVPLRSIVEAFIDQNLMHLPLFAETVARIEGNVERRNVGMKILRSPHFDTQIFRRLVSGITNDMEKIRLVEDLLKKDKKEELEVVLKSFRDGNAMVSLCRRYLESGDWTDEAFKEYLFRPLTDKGMPFYAYNVLIMILLNEQEKLPNAPLLIALPTDTTYRSFLQLLQPVNRLDPNAIATLIRYLSFNPDFQTLEQNLRNEKALKAL